jgi:NADPH:quinone reductase-like Zn-dependent oxidoreductase
MRAVLQDRYGSPEEALRIEDIPRPVPKDGEVLVEVHASTVTRGEAMGVRFKEYRFARLATGIRRPRKPYCGSEFAGRIEEVGRAVTEFRVGDEVFGIKAGANAEYVAVTAATGVIALKPASLTYEEAAAIPDGALLALTSIRPAQPEPGKSLLVYGAAGSIGSSAVQLLTNHFGCEVTAVCDTKDVELVRSLGAARVIDRFAQDFTKNGETYDIIFDAVGKHSFRRCRRSLKPGGTYVSMDLGFLYHLPLLSLITRFVGSRRARIAIGTYSKADLLFIRELIESGKYRPVIDRTYPLDEVVEATRYVESGQKTGSVVVRVVEVGDGERVAEAAQMPAPKE